MYDDIGDRIKTLAKVIAWIGIIVSVVVGIVTITTGIGIIVLILGPLLSWLSTLVLYGLGQLIENTDILVQQNITQQTNWQYYNDPSLNPQPNPQYYNEKNYQPNNSYNERKADISSSAKYCINCGKTVTGNFCAYCGTAVLKDEPNRSK